MKETRLAAQWVVVVLSILGTIATVGLRSPGLVLVLSIAFWIALVTYLVRCAGLLRGLHWFVPLLFLYYFTFHAQRRANPGILHGILGTDSIIHLGWANRWSVQERHAGWSVFTFVHHPVETIGRYLGVRGLGPEAVCLEVAVVGTLAAALVFRLLRDDVAPRLLRLLIAYFFALSFLVWALATVVDTYVASVLFLLVFVFEARAYFAGERRLPCVLGLVGGVLLSLSLENAYAPLVFALAYPVLRRPGGRPWRHLFLFAGIAGGVAVAATGLALLTGTRPPGDAAQALVRFVHGHVLYSSLFSPRTHFSVFFGELVMAVLAQSYLPIRSYKLETWPTLDGMTILYLALLCALVVVVLPAARRSSTAGRSPFSWLLLGIFAVRHLFMVLWVPGESVVFAGPSVAVLALFLGQGASVLEGNERRLFWYGSLLFALDLLLLLNNGAYLVGTGLTS